MEDGYKGFDYIIYLGILIVFYFVLKAPKKGDDEKGGDVKKDEETGKRED